MLKPLVILDHGPLGLLSFGHWVVIFGTVTKAVNQSALAVLALVSRLSLGSYTPPECASRPALFGRLPHSSLCTDGTKPTWQWLSPFHTEGNPPAPWPTYDLGIQSCLDPGHLSCLEFRIVWSALHSSHAFPRGWSSAGGKCMFLTISTHITRLAFWGLWAHMNPPFGKPKTVVS